MKLDIRQRLLATTLLVSAGAFATPAFAQDQVPPTDEQEAPSGPAEVVPPDEVEAQATGEPRPPGAEIIVTGSRVPRPNVESASPVTVVGEEAIEQSGVS